MTGHEPLRTISPVGLYYPGQFFGQYHLTATPYNGPDYGNRCFIFTGQGVARAGMMKNYYVDSPVLRANFARADRLASKNGLGPVSAFITEPKQVPAADKHIIRILCQFTLQVGLSELLMARHIQPKTLSGQSFGELVALVVAGIIHFEQAFAVIIARESHSPPEHSLGIMLVAYAGRQAVSEVMSDTEFHFSNFNSPKETVISVATDRAKAVRERLRQQGIKANLLRSVPHPYHTPVMQPVSDAMAAYLEKSPLSYQPPVIPLFSCVTKRLIDAYNFDPEEIDRIIIRLVVEPVDFVGQIESLERLGVGHFIEISPRAVCSVFARDTLGSGSPVKCSLVTDLLPQPRVSGSDKPMDAKGKSLFARINKVIGKVTGYEIEQISIDNKYQEELGIDSIKKAEIIVSVMDEMKVPMDQEMATSDFVTIRDTVEYLKTLETVSEDRETGSARQANFVRVLETWVEQPLEAHFKENGHELRHRLRIDVMAVVDDVSAVQRRILAALANSSAMTIVFHLDGTIPNDALFEQPVDEYAHRWFFPFVFLFRELLHRPPGKRFSCVLLTREAGHPLLEALNGLMKAVAKELPVMSYKRLIFAGNQELVEQVLDNELNASVDLDVHYREGKRFVLQLTETSSQARHLTDGAVVIALGGAKGITHSLLKHIAQRSTIVLYLVGRSSRSDAQVVTNLQAFSESPSRIIYRSLDATDRDALNGLFDQVKTEHGQIDLLINATGVIRIGLLKDQPDELIQQEWSNKVLPAFYGLSLAKRYQVGRVINFSSVISRFGGEAQTVYTAANAMVNGMTTAFNRQAGDQSAVSICWPPWERVGMTAHQGVYQRLREAGVALLNPLQADELFAGEPAGTDTGNLFYLDPVDRPIAAVFPADRERYQRLLGAPVSATRYKQRFSLEENSYLNAADSGGGVSVPTGTLVSMCYALGRLCLEGILELVDFTIHQPIPVGIEPLETCLKAEFTELGLQLSLKSTAVTYLTCQALEIETGFAEPLAGNREPMLIASHPMLERFGLRPYDRLAAWVDSAFEGIESARIGRIRIAAVGSSSKIGDLRKMEYPGMDDTLDIHIYSEDRFHLLSLIAIEQKGEFQG